MKKSYDESSDISCVKSVQIGSFSGPYFPAFRLNTLYLSVFSPNPRKYGPELTPYLDTFHEQGTGRNGQSNQNVVKKKNIC